jgi:hypothetical protein
MHVAVIAALLVVCLMALPSYSDGRDRDRMWAYCLVVVALAPFASWSAGALFLGLILAFMLVIGVALYVWCVAACEGLIQLVKRHRAHKAGVRAVEHALQGGYDD